MKAAVLHAYDTTLTQKQFVSYETVPDPVIEKPTDVIVRIGGAGVCRTDLHIVEGLWREKADVTLPYIMGHENAGWVEAVGSAVTGFKPGDPVICHPLVTSGHCLACRRGNDMHAVDSRFPGINANGGYAEFLLSGERALIKLPKALAPKDVAPYTDAGSDRLPRSQEGIAPPAARTVCGGHRRRRPRPHRHSGAEGALRCRDHRHRSFRPGPHAGAGIGRPSRRQGRWQRGGRGARADQRQRRRSGDRLRRRR